ncbi:SUMF1/EgtB/PvdO family nonheme iron enzyme [Enterobacter cloacae]|uniref:formylglycine-generating enzyme family protein n=1 Tax=Enterobacter cloacae TaxID=550 RepID=UPI002109D4C9|nr:SUMF1/EgtB/PvdO family nonheme iron enzyme [Enterobacter cloacae]MCQ4387012.1 formylglycine-generating enzyme family protein [Enterobacter cloacae]MCT9038855.1 formylglycine-generating enzyme family protein [Enterobacter cloacae]
MKEIIYQCSIFVILLISGCDNITKPAQHTPHEKAVLQKYINRVKADLVYVKGGSFWMGDFCKKMRNGGPYCSSAKDTKPAHEVELSSFSIGKFKVTHEDYNFYLKTAGLPKKYFKEKSYDEILSITNYFKKSPAVVTWTEANNYCAWLKNETGLPFSLPTEAQWEYAARGRGSIF